MNYSFKKKPLVIEAFQITHESREDNRHWPEWLNKAWNEPRGGVGSVYPKELGTGGGLLCVGTLEGPLLISWCDWIIRGVSGEL